jgi:subtilisin-like proprotein convertase family protein
MKPSRKYSYRILALLVVFVAICIAVPQLSQMSSTNKPTSTKSVKSVKSLPATAHQDSQKPGSDASQNKVEPNNPDFQIIEFPSSPPKGNVARPRATAAATAQGEVEPNGTSATATPLAGASVKVRGNVFPVADVDFYSFTATAGDRIYAATQTLFDASASGDSVLDLLNTDGTTVIENDPNDGTFNASSSSIAGALIPATGTYFLRVRHNVATSTIRPYDLHFNRLSGSPVAEVESNNTPATANPLPASGWVSGTISAVSPGESDFYSVTLAAGDTVYLSLDMNPERDANVWNGRLGFALFGNPPANQILLANDANAGASAADPNSEAFFFTVKDAGTYFVYIDSIVAAGLGANATYNLSVSVLPHTPATGNCTTYTSTNVPQVIPTGPGMVTSTITIPGNPRIADLDITINLNHTFMQDLDVHLVSPAGNDNGLFTDIGAATVGGPQTLMDIRLDDEAGLPPAFALSSSFVIQPELNFRLGWFDGENAGGTWTLVIRDDATGDGGTLNSWSITVCEPPAAPSCGAGFSQTTVFSTDFESGAAGFTHSGTADEWELGTPATAATAVAPAIAAFTTANSGVNAWKTDLDSSYNPSSSQDLLSPNINLAGLSGPITLSWAMRYQIESANFDHAFVDVRQVGNPSNSKRVWEWLDATMTNAPGNPAVNIGESAGWGIYTADISSFAGQNIEVVFHLDSDTTVEVGGLAIDDVSVTACMVAACTITCPANVTQTNDPNQCGAVVTYPPPTTGGSCTTVTCSPPSGSFFPVGTTTVTCQNTGGTPSCTFTVTITDDQPPSITCPANVTVANDPNQCGAVVTYPPPTITDNCPGTFTATCTPPSGSFFPVGTTTVNCTVDGFGGGGRGSGSCSTVTLTHSLSQAITPLNSVSCNSPAGHADNSYWRAFSLPAFSVNTAFNVSSIDIGIEEATAGIKAASGTKGTTPPASGGGKGGQTAGAPSKKGISKKSVARPAGGGTQPITVRIYQSSMAFPTGFPGSLTLIGTANVNVADQSGTILNVPITGTVSAGGELVVEVFTPSGEAVGNFFFIGSNAGGETGPSYISAADCGIPTPTATGAIGFPEMQIVMNVHGCPAGSSGPSCSFTVTVNDTQPPTITCPANITTVTPICGGTTTTVTYPAPTASDNCPGVTAACVPPSGSTFPIGVTTVTCTATDAAGNTATCSFTVTTFNACLQDDNNPNIVLLWNTTTGAYRFCCNGTTYTGTGSVINKGNSHTINHMAPDRRVNGVLDCGTSKGQGGLQSNAGTLICAINDRDIRNNTCSCGSAPVASSTK